MYKPSELEYNNPSVQTILKNIEERVSFNRKTSEHEKDFLCQAIYSSLNNPKEILTFNYCENYYFKLLFLIYWQDTSGKSTYYKPEKGILRQVTKDEANRDILYLKKVAEDWEKVIYIENHSDALLQCLARETRLRLKEYNEQQKTQVVDILNTNNLKILLLSKYIHHMSLLILEKYSDTERVFNLNDNIIEINMYSIVHILFRHYAKNFQTYLTKSFHQEFDPYNLIKELRIFFNIINESGTYKQQLINNINFLYKNVNYTIHVAEKTKQVKKTGNVKYNRLETLYPIEEKKVLLLLKQGYILKKIADDMGIYIQPNNCNFELNQDTNDQKNTN